MVTTRKRLEFWTEVHRVIGDEVKVTTCCCAAPGATAKGCAITSGNKTPCRCDCHRTKAAKKPTDASPVRGIR